MKKYSLRAIILGSMALLGIILVASIYFSISYQRNELTKMAVNEKTYLVETIKETMFSPVWRFRVSSIPDIDKIFLSSIAKLQDVVFLRVVGLDGDIRISSIEGEVGNFVEEPDILKVILGEEAIVKDMNYRGEKIKLIISPAPGDNTVWIGFSFKSIQKALTRTTIQSLLMGLGALLPIFIILYLTFRSITNPLRKMINACREIAAGNLDLKVDTKSKTEIGELVSTFNDMIKNLKESRMDLEESNNVLEIRVEERTKELEELNEKLEEKIRERTREVQQKMEELERFNKIAVGREMRMIELKEMMEELENENSKLLNNSANKLKQKI